jgi:hypothetical protein
MLKWLGLGYASRPSSAVDYHHYVLYEAVENPEKIDDSLFVSAYNEIYKNRLSCGLWTRKDSVPKELAIHELAATKHYIKCKERYWNMQTNKDTTYSPRELNVFRNMQLRYEYVANF